jgi:hypothetical protein
LPALPSMKGMPLRDLIPALQVSIGPVILISGGAFLLSVMTSRLGRIIDRVRQLAAALRGADPEDRAVMVAQLRILARRARIVRLAIIFASVAVLMAALLIIAIFFSAVFEFQTSAHVTVLFVTCMGCVIVAMLLFLKDINLSLAAVSMELGAALDRDQRQHRPN